MNSARSFRIEMHLLTMSEFEGSVTSITSVSNSSQSLMKLLGRLESFVDESRKIRALIEFIKLSWVIRFCFLRYVFLKLQSESMTDKHDIMRHFCRV